MNGTAINTIIFPENGLWHVFLLMFDTHKACQRVQKLGRLLELFNQSYKINRCSGILFRPFLCFCFNLTETGFT